jgi:tetratricopeptide (TPR) repeat protein
MVSSSEIMDLKRIVAKNPQSLVFAWLADLLRVASSGDKQKLDEALLTVNNGLAVNFDFLPGRLARGRILLEKGDLAGAKEDFAAVAEQDSFCSSAQKLFLETSEKLGQAPETEIYQKILGTLEPGVVVKVKVKPKTESGGGGVNAALDDLLDEDDGADDKEDSVISDLLLKTFENIFESGKQEQPVLDLDSDLDLVPYTPPARKSPPPAPDLEALVKEQLVSKVDNIPDLTGDMDSLLASASALPPVSGALSPPDPPQSSPSLPPSPPPKSSSPIDIDALIKEQLSSKMENLPDLTYDMDSLLASVPALEPSLSTSYSLPPIHDSPKSPSPPDIDALIKEQLSSKVEDMPDLTGDINSLLESNTISSTNYPGSPDVDALIKEQLSSKVEDVPDLTGDINSLLESMPPLDTVEPELEPYMPPASALAEPELEPYVPPTKKTDSMLAQKPTLTLAELYMDQGLPQEAAGVYKELLIQDPNNADLKTKLAMAETHI